MVKACVCFLHIYGVAFLFGLGPCPTPRLLAMDRVFNHNTMILPPRLLLEGGGSLLPLAPDLSLLAFSLSLFLTFSRFLSYSKSIRFFIFLLSHKYVRSTATTILNTTTTTPTPPIQSHPKSTRDTMNMYGALSLLGCCCWAFSRSRSLRPSLSSSPSLPG